MKIPTFSLLLNHLILTYTSYTSRNDMNPTNKKASVAFKKLLLLLIIFGSILSYFFFNHQLSRQVFAVENLVPIADSHVRSDIPGTNYGTKPTLEVDGSPIKIIYLKFDLSQYPSTNINTAKLRLKVVDASVSTYSVKNVNDLTWQETTINYNNRPTPDTTLATFKGSTAGSYIDIDLSNFIKSNGGKIISIAIDSTGSDGLDVNSREAAADKPTLILDTSLPTPTPTISEPATPTPTDTQLPTPTPTQPPTSGDVTVAAGGDVACGSSTSTTYPCKYKETSDILMSMNPDAVLALGDLQYNSGSLKDFQNYYHPTWGRIKSKTYPVVGNHEYGTSGAAGYFDYFNGVGISTGPAGIRGKGYYSFDLGAWHIIALNSNCTKISDGCSAGSVQEQWLRADLAAHQNKCTLAMWHHPRFSSGHDGSPTIYSAFWQALYDYDADVVLVGHSHDYERFAPQTASGQLDTARGIREFVIGTGGRDFTGWSTAAPNSEVKQNKVFGVLKLALHATSYDWEFMPIAGSVYSDSGTTQCH